jgi:hypothetical protein
MARTAVRGRLTWQAGTVASVTRETASDQESMSMGQPDQESM